jgi:hypothetical protein
MIQHRNHRRRRGSILVIVVAFLGLGLGLGIAFLFMANQHAVNMRIYREAIQSTISDETPPYPDDIANSAFAQLIYDLPDDPTGVDSALRGGSLARAMYGAYYSGNPTAPSYTGNTIPFNGVGKFNAAGGPFGLNFFQILNYQYRQADGNVYDPERLGSRVRPSQNTWAGAPPNNYIPADASYTYPDHNNLYLAAIDPTTGQVLVPSFFRPNLFGGVFNDTTNANWTNPAGKYLIQRPRTQENPAFSGPGTAGYLCDANGEVVNLAGRPAGGFDSIWMDIGLPMKKWRGKNYKPLVAWLVLDMDGRINIHTAGNLSNAGNPGSLQGWGPWEANLNYILTANGGSEAKYTMTGGNGFSGKWGNNAQPDRVYAPDGLGGNNAQAMPLVPFYSQINYSGGGTGGITLPNGGQTSPSFASPRFESGPITQLANHPLIYNPYLLSSIKPAAPGGNDRSYGPGELRLLLNKYNGDQTNYALSELGQLLQMNLQPDYPSGSANPRLLLTPNSSDLLRPGLAPWLKNIPGGDARRFTLTQPGPVGASGFYPPAAQPTPATFTFPDPATTRGTAAAANTVNEFSDQTWKSIQSAFASIDVNRPLRDYRVDPTKAFEAPGNVTAASAAAAITDRQALAKDIFDRLCYACGADNSPTNLTAVTPAAGAAPTFIPTAATPEFLGLRYLAQIAVNIVDQIDNDDYMTPFVWNTTVATPFTAQNAPLAVVFGTELPRLVINEAAIRIENGTTANMTDSDYDQGLVPAMGQPPKATFYVGKIWVELLNPLTTSGASTAALSHGGGAPLRFNGNDVYRLVLTQNNKLLRHADNVDGRTDATGLQNNAPLNNNPAPPPTPNALVGLGSASTGVTASVYGAGADVIPPMTAATPPYSQGRALTSSFCLVGPAATTPGDSVPSSITSSLMQFRIETAAVPNGAQNGVRVPADLVLQRLACPHLPPSASNPYITVDYFVFGPQTTAQAWDGRTVDTNNNIATPTPVTTCRSYGRMQPYAAKQADPADLTDMTRMQNPTTPTTGIQHTFFSHNGQGASFATAGGTLTQPFTWLVQFDRPLISPIELMQVSVYKPHELMQQFVTAAGTSQHLATAAGGLPASGWTDDAHRLHRALALLDTRSKMMGIPQGGRMPGLVNINTIWNQAIWNAICAPDPSNFFTQTDVNNAWGLLSTSRTPSGTPSAVGSNDKPFWSLGGPIDPGGGSQFPAGLGVNNTVLRGAAAVPTLDVATVSTHPYARKDLLNKVFSKLTTRSNVFAVWVTIGYFEVPPGGENFRPMQLGQEIGIADGTNVRHQYFAVVDRTNLSIDPNQPNLQGPRPIFFAYEPQQTGSPPTDPATPGSVTAYIPGTASGGKATGIYEGSAWTIQVGTPIVVDVGGNQETVTVTAVGSDPGGGAAISFNCANPHARGCALMISNSLNAVPTLGNPGPQPGFYFRDPRYTPVIPVVVRTQ